MTDKGDAEYWCKALYGSQYYALSYKTGMYGALDEAGAMGWKIFRGNHMGHCLSLKYGKSVYGIPGTHCDGRPCRIINDLGQHEGIYDLICSGK